MIGFYDYTVWLTYISLMTSVYGIFCSFNGNLTGGVVCLALSGFFDAFDGAIARTKKDRTSMQKAFGIQVDSLSDIVCFGVGPAAIGYSAGMRSVFGVAVLLLLCTAGLIRLAYFNVSEEERQKETAEKRKYYQGMPITSTSVTVPLYYLLHILFDFPLLPGLYVLLGLNGLLFIVDIKVPKPRIRDILMMSAVVFVLAVIAFFVK